MKKGTPKQSANTFHKKPVTQSTPKGKSNAIRPDKRMAMGKSVKVK